MTPTPEKAPSLEGPPQGGRQEAGSRKRPRDAAASDAAAGKRTLEDGPIKAVDSCCGGSEPPAAKAARQLDGSRNPVGTLSPTPPQPEQLRHRFPRTHPQPLAVCSSPAQLDSGQRSVEALNSSDVRPEPQATQPLPARRRLETDWQWLYAHENGWATPRFSCVRLQPMVPKVRNDA